VETERLVLRLFQPDDLDALYDIQSRTDVHRYLYSDPRSRDEVRAKLDERISDYSRLTKEGDSLLLAIVRKDTRAMVGDLLLHWISQKHMQAEVGYVLHPGHNGHGFATEAARHGLLIGFQRMRMHRIIGRLDARNTASARVLERLGMRREAHFRQNEFVKGEWCDEVVYAMLASEWAARN
jgi:RimJ/RimL family protein N-acetyltransferase